MSLPEVRPRGNATKAELPSVATRSTCGPPGNGNPRILATLSKASPAASSMVLPSDRTSWVTSGTSRRLECPPETSKALVGSGSRPCSTMSTATWAARWLTAKSGWPRGTAREVGATGDLGDHASEARVLLDAARDRVGEQDLTADNPDTSFVAGCLDAEHQGAAGHSVNLMICASTSAGW